MNGETVHLAFGPVQEFIGQARRTRDLWAGSYLLSYLAAQALARVEAQEGVRVVLPSIEGNALVEAVRTGRAPRSPGERVGSVPHVAEIGVPAGAGRRVAETAVQSWRQAWERVSGAVYDHVRQRSPGWAEATDGIWARQVAGLWTPAWVLGGAEGMARRKTLRAFDLNDEPGEKCTCCGAREALHAGDRSRAGVRGFWMAVAQLAGSLNVQPEGKERLCAICVIKRFFPLVADRALGAQHWGALTGFPSTSTLAGLAWRLQVLEKGKDDGDLRAAVALYVEALQTADRHPDIPPNFFPALRAAADTWPAEERAAARSFIRFDGDWFLPEVVRDPERAELLGPRQSQVLDTFSELQVGLRAAGLPQPGTYYALLAMDGDRMGKLLRDNADRKAQVSQALGVFSGRVQQIVEGPEASGVLLYAGGDDVLALLPKDTALATAAALRDAYFAAFATELPAARVTISAGLVYAHMLAPLRSVVATAHRLLEDKAKEEAGRDALAVAVWKRPGISLDCARKWDCPDGSGLVAGIHEVRDGLAGGVYSRGFLYHLRDLLPAAGPAWGADAVEKLLLAEYLKSQSRLADRAAIEQTSRALPTDRAEAEQRVKVLRRLAWPEPGGWDQDDLADPSRKDRRPGVPEHDETEPVLLVAFLAEEGEG